MRDRDRPGHPLSGALRPDLSRPPSSSRTDASRTLGLILFLLCSIFEVKPEREFPHGKHHARPARDTQADRLCPRSLALRNQTLLPWEVQQDRRSLSAWIEAQAQLRPVSDMDRLPTSKQVAFAEKLARIKRRAVPDECFHDKGLMSKWIDGNK